MRVACRGAQWQHARVDGVCVRGGVYQLTSDTRLKNIVVMRDTRECTCMQSLYPIDASTQPLVSHPKHVTLQD